MDAAPNGRIRDPAITADCAVAHCQRSGFVADAAALADAVGGSGPVSANSTVGESHRPAIVVDATTAPPGVIAADRAVIYRQRSVITVNTTPAARVPPLRAAIRDGQAGDGCVNSTTHVEDAVGKVRINC